jgi:HEAT repeat protein
MSGIAMVADSPAVPLSEWLSPSGTRLIVLGEGGTGKTTILLRTAIDLCERARADRNAPAAIYARLNFFDAQANAFGELMNVIARSAGLDRADAETLWAQQRRPCVFLLDGFNEVSPSAREACALALSELLQHRWHSYLITSRPGEDVDKLAVRLDAQPLEIVSLDDDQVQQYLDSYGLPDLPRRIEPRLRDFLRTPFLLWALAQSQTGAAGDKLPSSTGRLYEKLIDNYIFGSREQAKTGEARPTRYHYERVKKPVLSEIAAQMCMVGVTRRPEDRRLLVSIRDRLREIRAEYEGIYPTIPYELMPDPPAATELLEEVARNGVIRRSNATIEFSHESIRDYFAAGEIAGWPLAEIVTIAPPLIWRQVTPGFDEYRVSSSMAGPLIMLAGLRNDPELLVCALADRNPLIAAYCHAEAPTQRAADYLTSVLRSMLQDRHPARRRIGCQCIGQAKLSTQDVVASLLERIRSDAEIAVRDAAARALGRIGDHQAIRQLVAEALADTAPRRPAEVAGRETGRVLWRLYSGIAVREVFEAWRSAEINSDQRTRAQQLLAAMRPRLVRATLHAIGIEGRAQDDGTIVQDAERALSQLDSWKPVGIPTAEHMRYLTERFWQRFSKQTEIKLGELSTYSTGELLALIHNEDASARAAAVKLLQKRNEPALQDAFLEALGAETHGGVRDALLDALHSLAGEPGFLNAWSSRLTDPDWIKVASLDDPTLRDHLPNVVARRSDRYVSLNEDIRAELIRQGVSVDDKASVTAKPGYWDITPGSWGGRKYQNQHSCLRIVPVHDSLCVQDLGKSARLVMAGAGLGERAVPVLRQALLADPPSPLLQEAIPEALAAIGGPSAIHDLCAMLPTLEAEDQPTGPPESTLLEAIASIRNPYAVEQLLKTLSTLAPARPRFTADSEWTTEIPPESGLTRLTETADALITALLAIGAQTQLSGLAQDAFADGDDTLRHVATVTAARLDILAAGLEHLLIQAVYTRIPATRLAGVRALGQHETQSRRAALIEACLNDPDEKVRAAAATAIRGYQGDEGIRDLITHLTQDESFIRARAADALGLIGDELAVTPLADALHNGPHHVQISAARGLRLLGAPQDNFAIDQLVTIATTDLEMEIRLLAARELDQIPGGTKRLFAPFDEAFDAGRYKDALRLLDDMAPLIADAGTLHWLRAWTLRCLQRLSEALDELDAILRAWPTAVHALSFRAELLFRLDRKDEGLMAIREAVAQEPDDADLQAKLGWWAYASGHLQESIHASQRALELQPGNIPIQLNLGLALLASGDDDLAERTYQQAIEHAILGDPSESVTQLTTAIEELAQLEQQTSEHKAVNTAIRSQLQNAADNLTAGKQKSAIDDNVRD